MSKKKKKRKSKRTLPTRLDFECRDCGRTTKLFKFEVLKLPSAPKCNDCGGPLQSNKPVYWRTRGK